MNEDVVPVLRSATNDDCERVQALVFTVLREYGLPSDPAGTDKDLTDIEAHYPARGGAFELVEDGAGNLLGTVGLYPVDNDVIELRKMYFAPELRGKGWGKWLLAKMIEKARLLGYREIHLDTIAVLKEAIQLYEKFGFKPFDVEPTPRRDRGYYLKLDDDRVVTETNF